MTDHRWTRLRAHAARQDARLTPGAPTARGLRAEAVRLAAAETTRLRGRTS